MNKMVGCLAALVLASACAQDVSDDQTSSIDGTDLGLSEPAKGKDHKGKHDKDICANLRSANGDGEMDILLERLNVTSVTYDIEYEDGILRTYTSSFKRGISFEDMCEEIVDLGITSKDKEIEALDISLEGFVNFEEDIDSAVVRVTTSADVRRFKLNGRECKEVKHGDRNYAASLQCSGKSGRNGKFDPAFEADKDYGLELELEYDRRALKDFGETAEELSDLQIGLVPG